MNRKEKQDIIEQAGWEHIGYLFRPVISSRGGVMFYKPAGLLTFLGTKYINYYDRIPQWRQYYYDNKSKYL